MAYEVNNRINWFVVFSDILISSFLMITSSFFSGFENLKINFGIAMLILILVTLWRMQSYKIVVDDKIRFKRILLPDYKISFDDIKSIKIFDDIKPRRFTTKRAFIEVDTKARYFTYYLDHFDLSEIKALIIFLEEHYQIRLDAN